MSRNRTEQQGSQQRSGVQQAVPPSQETWEGGGREPIHPDDIEDEGENTRKNNVKQQLRSDDN